jgi:glycogen synthase
MQLLLHWGVAAVINAGGALAVEMAPIAKVGGMGDVVAEC